jgi:light-regulated signal transduction histidine kinase (bacteriophytochrome)
MLKQSFSSLNAEQNRLFERVDDATKRMNLLIDDLLDYSHVSMGVNLLEEIDLNKKVATVLRDLEVAIQEKGAHISVSDLPVVKGHRRQLQQLFHNLIQNALKYSKKDTAPVIHISAELVMGSNNSFELPNEDKNRSFHLIRVQNNGIEFEQVHALQIYQMFKRLHGSMNMQGRV